MTHRPFPHHPSRPGLRAAVAIAATLAFPGGVVDAAAQVSRWNITRHGLIHRVPAMASVRVTREVAYRPGDGRTNTLDLYLPANATPGTPLPAVIFINGVGDAGDNPFRDWAIYQDWGRLVAAEGMAGVVYGVAPERTREGPGEVADFLRREGPRLGIDGERLGLFACSANAGVGLPWAMGAAPGLKCAVIYYGGVPVDSLRPDLPVYYVKAQKDAANLNNTIDGLWTRARESMAPWTIVLGRGLPHAFDAVDPSEPSRAIVRQTVEFWRAHLVPLPPAVEPSVTREVNRFLYGLEHREAARLLEQEAARDTSDPEVERLLLLSYRNLADHERGIPLARKLLKRQPENPNLHTSHGMLLNAAGRRDEAIAALEKSAGLGARDYITWHQLIVATLGADRLEKAVAHATRATELFPMVAATHYNLACAHARSGAAEPALAALEAAIRAGFSDRRGMEADPDLESLRGHPRFAALLGQLR
jgi:tetratricopeptide (TPR) repeat protein